MDRYEHEHTRESKHSEAKIVQFSESALASIRGKFKSNSKAIDLLRPERSHVLDGKSVSFDLNNKTYRVRHANVPGGVEINISRSSRIRRILAKHTVSESIRFRLSDPNSLSRSSIAYTKTIDKNRYAKSFDSQETMRLINDFMGSI